MAEIDKNAIKQNLSIQEVMDLVASLGGDPRLDNGNILVSATICHNHPGEGSHKLYYYDNTKLFKCFTSCDETFDIFDLVIKVKKQQGETWTLYNAISYIANYFGLDISQNFSSDYSNAREWRILSKWEANKKENQSPQIVEIPFLDDAFLSYFPQPRIAPWEREGISYDVIKEHNIRYDPCQCSIVIPHYDKDDHLLGVRERTLIKENEVYGKYRPAIIQRKMYNHPLSFNLYNLNKSKEAIAATKMAVVFEGEKSTLLYSSFFSSDYDISVACCGSSLIAYQVQLLLDLGVREIIVGFDKQFQELGDDECNKWAKKLYHIHNKYGSKVQISYLYDKENLLGYKDSPIDAGPDVFQHLFKKRIRL